MKQRKIVFFLVLSIIWSAGVFAGPIEKCGTPEALEAFRQGVKLPRPTSGPKYVYSTHFIIHFDTTGTDACTRAYAESVSKYAEYSWAKQVDTLKWAAPPPDGAGPDNRYDIYIRNISALGITSAEALYSTPYPNGVTSYIQVDNNIAGWGLLQVTVAHEFNHACQLRYSWLEGRWFMENCATWMEDICYDNVNDYVNYLLYSTPNPLDSTHFAITSGSDSDFYWYAGAIWAMFLQEFYNDSCPRFSWERMGNRAGENTLSGIDSTLITKYSSNLMTALKNYAIWRYFTGTRADPTYHFSESNLWPTSYVLRTHNTYPTSGTESPRTPDGPGGTNFIQFYSGSEVLKISFDGQDGYNWGAFAIGYRVPSQSVEQEIGLNSSWYGTTNIIWSGNSHIALIPVVTHWTSSANNLTFAYTCSLKAVTKDVGVTEIQYPTGTIDSIGLIVPRAKVKNFGSDSITFQVTLKIGSTYTSVRSKKLNAEIEDTVNFAAWQTRRGTYSIRCSTYVSGDANKNNDTLSSSVNVIVNDVGVTAITEPDDTIYRGNLQPKATVRNYGTQSATFYAFFKIFNASGTQVYLDSSLVSDLNQNASSTKTFKTFLFENGKYYLRCSTALSNDNNPINNVKLDSVFVVFIPPWTLKDSVPLGPDNKAVSCGGALAVGVSGNIYALKGNNTREFYVYNVGGNSWTPKETIPYAIVNDVVQKKKVYRGGALAYNNHASPNMIYAVKGNNTLEFWAYNVSTDTWVRKQDVPFNTVPIRKVAGGAGLAYLKRGNQQYVYLLKGNRTLEFYVFHCQGDTWRRNLAIAPAGNDIKAFRDGSCIVAGNDKIYALKGGANYNEFWCYNPASNSWSELESLPRRDQQLNKSLKVKDGAALCYNGDSLIYAFKGGSSQSFWVYNINRNRWTEKDTIPRSDGRKKVSGGGSLAFQGGKVYALKGNRTREFWCYDPQLSIVNNSPPLDYSPVTNLTQQNQVLSNYVTEPCITVESNPLQSHSKILLNIKEDCRVNIKLYNSLGQFITTLVDKEYQIGNYSIPLNSCGFQAGIYFLKAEIDEHLYTRKLIIK